MSGGVTTGTDHFETRPSDADPQVSHVGGGSIEAYFDSTGAVHFECRSFRGRTARVSTPASAAIGTTETHHLVVQCSYDGVAAWLDGAKFEDGYANLLHVFGLSANIIGVTWRNGYNWMIGRAAWDSGGNSKADITVDEFALYLEPLSTGQAQDLAQSGAADPLAHPIWGLSSEDAGTGSGTTAAINSAIAARSAAGGGTVNVTPGTYTGTISLLSNVRIRTAGTVNISNAAFVISTPAVTPTTLSGGSSLANGSRVLTITNSAVAGDVIGVQAIPGTPPTGQADRRYDDEYNTDGQAPDPFISEGQTFTVQSATGSAITLSDANGWDFEAIASAARNVFRFPATRNVAIEGNFRSTSTSGSSASGAIFLQRVNGARLIGCHAIKSNDDGHLITGAAFSYGVQMRDCLSTGANTAINLQDGVRWAGASHCVSSGSTVVSGRHGCDFSFGGNDDNCVMAMFCEHHDGSWANTVSGTGGRAAALGAHGPHKHSIIWNWATNWGGPLFGGIKMDVRWAHCTGTNSDGSISYTDGAYQAYVRDVFIGSAEQWFRTSGGTVSVDSCVFSNIRRGSGAGGAEDHNGEYGSLAAGTHNRYANVDEPWLTGGTAWQAL